MSDPVVKDVQTAIGHRCLHGLLLDVNTHRVGCAEFECGNGKDAGAAAQIKNAGTLEARQVCEENGFDISEHRSRPIVASEIQDADLVLMIYRDEYYNEQTEKRGIAEVVVAKHRAGSTGPIDMTFMPEFTLFSDLGRG